MLLIKFDIVKHAIGIIHGYDVPHDNGCVDTNNYCSGHKYYQINHTLIIRVYMILATTIMAIMILIMILLSH